MYGLIIATGVVALAIRFSLPELIGLLTKPKPLEVNQRQFLFEVEHQVLVFNKHGFQPLALAIEAGHSQGSNDALAPNMQGEILSATVDDGMGQDSTTYTAGALQRYCVV